MRLYRIAVLIAAGLAANGLNAQSRTKAGDPDVKEMRDYRMSMDVIQRYVRAVDAVSKDPAAKKCSEANSPGNAPTLDAGEKLLKTCPPAVALLAASGFKPREFLVVTGALIGDVMAVGMKKSGTIKEYPPSISPQNAAFFEQNFDRIQALLAPVMNGGK